MPMTREELAHNLKNQYPEIADHDNNEVVNSFLRVNPQFRGEVVDLEDGGGATAPPAKAHAAAAGSGNDYAGSEAGIAGDFAKAGVQGLKKAGIGTIQLANRFLSSLKKPGPEGESMVPYDPAVYAGARKEARDMTPPGVAGKIGSFLGEAAPAIATGALAPEGMGARFLWDTASGALQSEIAEPGSAGTGALLGGMGAAAGLAMSPRTGMGQKFAARQARKADDELVKVLSPGSDEAAAKTAREAVPFMRSEGVVSSNPLRNTTGQILDRAFEQKTARGAKLNAAYDAAEAAGGRLDETPVRAGLQKARQEIEVHNTQVPHGTQLKVTFNDIYDNGGINYEVAKSLGLDNSDIHKLALGARQGGLDEIMVTLPDAVVPAAGAARHNALNRQEGELARLIALDRAAEAVQTGKPLADIPPGLRVKGARSVRQQLDEGKFRGVVQTTTSAAGKQGEIATGDLMRHEISSQFPSIGKQAEPFHHLANIEALMQSKATKQATGTAADRYAMVRALATIVRGGSLGILSLPAATSAVNSSALHAVNSQLRSALLNQIRTGNAEAAARTLARIGEMLLGDEELPDANNNRAKLRGLGVNIKE